MVDEGLIATSDVDVIRFSRPEEARPKAG